MLIRERLGRIRGKFKGGRGSVGVFAVSENLPSTRQSNPAHTSLRSQTRSPSLVPSAQPAPPQIEYHIVSGRNTAREARLRADTRAVSPSEDFLCESVDIQDDSAPLAVPSLDPSGPSSADPAPHASIPIPVPVSPPTYASISEADNLPSQVANSEPVVQVAPLAAGDASDCSDVGRKDQVDPLDATPDTLLIPSNPQPVSSLSDKGGGNSTQPTTPSLNVPNTVTTSSSLATSRIPSAVTTGPKVVNRTCAYLAGWHTRPLFPLYFLSIFVLLVPLII